MSDFPDLVSFGYIIEEELGRNREGGRITWKGIDLNLKQTVVIKQFCFAQANSSWSGYKAYYQEIKILQDLDHPYIPKYLDSLETETGFCLIQEYVAARKSSHYRHLTIVEVKQVAIHLLDILIYLQQQDSPVLHQDIKPDNILLDEALNAYLIDFGFSRQQNKEISGSSVFKGTPGFIAPEQIIQPTSASDIYSLGVTLVCLLTNKSIEEIKVFTALDNPYQLILAKLLPNLDKPFLKWLNKMTNARPSQRFPDAMSAKKDLLKLDLSIENSSIDISRIVLWSNSLVEPRVIAGTLGIFGLTTTTIWVINFAFNRVELTISNTMIAILAAIAISITQLGAAAIASSDRQARVQGTLLSVVVPIILVSVSGLIWGVQQTVVISTAIAIAEILLLSYYWWQIPYARSITLLKVGSWLSVIASGIFLGLKLI